VGLGVALALVMSLVVFSRPWSVGGSLVAGAALALLGVRILAGKKWGGEIAVWGSLLLAVAGFVVSIIAACK
jgi:hypothetical protein